MRCPRCSANPVPPARTAPCMPRVGPTRLIRMRAFSSTHSGCIGYLEPHHPEIACPRRHVLRGEDNVDDGTLGVDAGEPPQVLQVSLFQQTCDDGSGIPLQGEGAGIHTGEQAHSMQGHRRSPLRRVDSPPYLGPSERTDVGLDHARPITVRHVRILLVPRFADRDAHMVPPASIIYILLYKSIVYLY